MNANEKILNYLKGNIERKEIFVFQTENYLEITCEIKSNFITPNEYASVKGYLRRNGFQSDGNGTHTRYNEGHKPKPLAESLSGLIHDYGRNVKIAYLKELIKKGETEKKDKYLKYHIDKLKTELIISFDVIID